MKDLWNYHGGQSTGVVSINKESYEIPSMEAKRAFMFPEVNYELTRYFGFGMPANDIGEGDCDFRRHHGVLGEGDDGRTVEQGRHVRVAGVLESKLG